MVPNLQAVVGHVKMILLAGSTEMDKVAHGLRQGPGYPSHAPIPTAWRAKENDHLSTLETSLGNSDERYKLEGFLKMPRKRTKRIRLH